MGTLSIKSTVDKLKEGQFVFCFLFVKELSLRALENSDRPLIAVSAECTRGQSLVLEKMSEMAQQKTSCYPGET